jgi:hypothetical protein
MERVELGNTSNRSEDLNELLTVTDGCTCESEFDSDLLQTCPEVAD